MCKCNILILIFAISLYSSGCTQNIRDDESATKVIAHRGAWKESGLPQNSLASFRKAINLGCNGSEFDVSMTVDDSLVIAHGPMHQGLRIAITPYQELIAKKLSNGEQLSTLREFIAAGSYDNNYTTFICEIKGQATPERKYRVAEKVISHFKKADLLDQVLFIGFDYEIMKHLIDISPGVKVHYLGKNKTMNELASAGFSGVSYRYRYFQQHPELIDLGRSLGLKLNTGTVNDSLVMDWFITRGFDYIGTDEPELLLRRVVNSHSQKE
ncbi:MAG: glycerophosphodiester phosphodiesterase family protein [Bacteroidota bacterium]